MCIGQTEIVGPKDKKIEFRAANPDEDVHCGPVCSDRVSTRSYKLSVSWCHVRRGDLATKNPPFLTPFEQSQTPSDHPNQTPITNVHDCIPDRARRPSLYERATDRNGVQVRYTARLHNPNEALAVDKLLVIEPRPQWLSNL